MKRGVANICYVVSKHPSCTDIFVSNIWGTISLTILSEDSVWPRGFVMGFGAFHFQVVQIQSMSLVTDSHYHLTPVQWPLGNKLIVSI